MKATLYSLPRITDPRGNLSFFQNQIPIPFKIAKVQWIYDVPGGSTSYNSETHETEEFIIALSGSFDIVTDDSVKKETFHMNLSYNGLLIPKGVKRTIENVSTNSIALIITSSENEESKQQRDIADSKNLHYVHDCSVIELCKHTSDGKGNYSVVRNNHEIPFSVNRVYFLYDVPAGESRGGHAHKSLNQMLFAVSGSFKVELDDGNVKRSITLNRPNQGLLIKPGIWRTLDDFSSGSVCLVLASKEYDESDYIREYDDFVTLRNEKENEKIHNK